ncbi:hypothetical protein A0H81_14519 [Grifola frondosa]|uniref:C2H2-type domain-containing protein n=1 Tax=Grifola frondosa TaxID=5627 RepID=A0A1C7LKP4_GRIFR|nr:hypothetical protein A0H81_14684 [Grifola frondosa]OBZ65447.1 hypothetical protein A0H81_14519 [Grifola frondosa]
MSSSPEPSPRLLRRLIRNPVEYLCRKCHRYFKSKAGRTLHFRVHHPSFPAAANPQPDMSSDHSGSSEDDHGTTMSAQRAAIGEYHSVTEFSDQAIPSEDVVMDDIVEDENENRVDDERSITPSVADLDFDLQGEDLDRLSVRSEFWKEPSLWGSEGDDDAPAHVEEDHPLDDMLPEGLSREYHEHIDGTPCDEDGNYLPPDTPPTFPPAPLPDDWSPYRNRVEFEAAGLLYTHDQMAGKRINDLMDLWTTTLLKYNDHGPFANSTDLYRTIDSTRLGTSSGSRLS